MSTLHRNDPRDLSPSWPLMSVLPILLAATLGMTAPFTIGTFCAFLIGEWWSKNIRLRFGQTESPLLCTFGSVCAAITSIIGIRRIYVAANRESSQWPINGIELAIVILAISIATICVFLEIRRFTRNGQPKPAVENDS